MFFNIFTFFSRISYKSVQDGEELIDEERGTPPSPLLVRWPLFLLLISVFALLAAAGFVCVFVALREQGFQQFSCHLDDQECLQQICPQGMKWNPDKEECSVPEGWDCCTVSNMKICYQTEGSDQSCPYLVQIAGVSPFLKEFCRPGYIWVPRLKRCWRKI